MYKPPEDKKPVMLAKHLHLIPEKKRVFPAIGDVKYDGVYAYMILREGDYRIFSRTGMQYTSLKHLEEVGKRMFLDNGKQQVLIFEVHHPEYPINVISGYCRDQSEQHPELIGIAHDMIPYEDFIEGYCKIQYGFRRRYLASYINGYEFFSLPETHWCNSEEVAQVLFESVTSKGGEGVILRNPAGVWIAGKRNADLIKIKEEISYDLEVTHVFKGSGKYSETTGTVGCKFRLFGKEDGLWDTVLCSGMSDKQRNEWWRNPSLIIGKIVKVDAMTFTSTGLLREPRFKEVREDKTEADF